jgi:hypothetical protein
MYSLKSSFLLCGLRKRLSKLMAVVRVAHSNGFGLETISEREGRNARFHYIRLGLHVQLLTKWYSRETVR